MRYTSRDRRMDPTNEPALQKTDDLIGARARHDARMQMGNESVKGLLLINGGGAVALLAFLQQIWTSNHLLAWWVLLGLCAFTLGITLAAFINHVRVDSSLAHGQSEPTAGRLRMRHIYLTRASIACFATGCGIVIYGGFHSLCL
jgi:hypothetical protein